MTRILWAMLAFWLLCVSAFATAIPQNPQNQNQLPGVSFESAQNELKLADSALDGVSLWQYGSVVGVLLGLFAVLLYVKSRLGSSVGLLPKATKSKVVIESLTTLTPQHKILIFTAHSRRYTVILGPATLLDASELENFDLNA